MSEPLRIAILGSTGSIGLQALDVASRNPDRVRVVALAAHSDVDTLVEQARTHSVAFAALADPDAATTAAGLLADVEVWQGPGGVEDLACLDGVDLVLNAVVGAAGLRVTTTALKAGKTLALANKESLVVGGDLVSAMARPGQIVPVDSEHSAIFQCLAGESARDVVALWLTASGGPFRGWRREDLEAVSAAQALAHPTWKMGPKITVDSATLMNKGLEIIEAHHLFAVEYDRIRVVVHPQSCIHSMVEFSDGSVKAHLGVTDMRIPIQYALSHPERWDAPASPVDFTTLGALDLEPPDLDTFRCLGLAVQAGRAGGTSPAVLNAANEVGVASFLQGRCGFLDIERVVEATLEAHDTAALESIEQVEAVDAWARAHAAGIVGAF